MQTLKPTTKPSKQRKRLYEAPAHIRHKHFGAPLSPELQTSQKTKTLPVRSGDTVRVLRGDNKGFEGKITRIDRAHYRVYVEGLTREKVDGTAIPVSVHPSKVMITSLNLDDKWRKKILERKRQFRKEPERAPEKPKKLVEPEEKITEKEVSEKETAIEEKTKEKKPRAKKKAVRKPKTEKAKEEVAETIVEEKPKAQAEEKPKAKRPRTRRKTATKKAEEEGGT